MGSSVIGTGRCEGSLLPYFYRFQCHYLSGNISTLFQPVPFNFGLLNITDYELNNLASKSDERCPATWDGWQCWPDGGQPDHVEYRSCPSYISFFSNGRRDACGSYAEKTCESAGQWKLNDRV